MAPLFLSQLETLHWLTPSHGIITAYLLGFACVHSGLAALRPWGESKIGARAYRVLFALVSIPLATGLIIYFFNHRYDGLQPVSYTHLTLPTILRV